MRSHIKATVGFIFPHWNNSEHIIYSPKSNYCQFWGILAVIKLYLSFEKLAIFTFTFEQSIKFLF